MFPDFKLYVDFRLPKLPSVSEPRSLKSNPHLLIKKWAETVCTNPMHTEKRSSSASALDCLPQKTLTWPPWRPDSNFLGNDNGGMDRTSRCWKSVVSKPHSHNHHKSDLSQHLCYSATQAKVHGDVFEYIFRGFRQHVFRDNPIGNKRSWVCRWVGNPHVGLFQWRSIFSRQDWCGFKFCETSMGRYLYRFTSPNVPISIFVPTDIPQMIELMGVEGRGRPRGSSFHNMVPQFGMAMLYLGKHNSHNMVNPTINNPSNQMRSFSIV